MLNVFSILFFFLATLRGMRDLSSNLCPLHWELRVLTIGPLGKSLYFLFLIWLMLILFYFFNKFIYLFIFGGVGSSLLRGLSLVAVSWGYPFVVVRRLLIVVASLVAELGL